jgi:hypothetical protein
MRLPAVLTIATLATLPACGKGANATRGPKPVKAKVLTVEHKEVRRDVLSVGSLFPYEEVAVSLSRSTGRGPATSGSGPRTWRGRCGS